MRGRTYKDTINFPVNVRSGGLARPGRYDATDNSDDNTAIISRTSGLGHFSLTFYALHFIIIFIIIGVTVIVIVILCSNKEKLVTS